MLRTTLKSRRSVIAIDRTYEKVPIFWFLQKNVKYFLRDTNLLNTKILYNNCWWNNKYCNISFIDNLQLQYIDCNILESNIIVEQFYMASQDKKAEMLLCLNRTENAFRQHG